MEERSSFCLRSSSDNSSWKTNLKCKFDEIFTVELQIKTVGEVPDIIKSTTLLTFFETNTVIR